MPFPVAHGHRFRIEVQKPRRQHESTGRLYIRHTSTLAARAITPLWAFGWLCLAASTAAWDRRGACCIAQSVLSKTHWLFGNASTRTYLTPIHWSSAPHPEGHCHEHVIVSHLASSERVSSALTRNPRGRLRQHEPEPQLH